MDEYPRKGRGTQGVTLIKLAQDETLQAIERVDVSLEEEDEMLTGPVVPGDETGPGLDPDVLRVAGHDPDALAEAPADDEPA